MTVTGPESMSQINQQVHILSIMVQLEFHKYFMFPVSNYENFDKDCSTNKSEEIM